VNERPHIRLATETDLPALTTMTRAHNDLFSTSSVARVLPKTVMRSRAPR
jgi:hypothetical protein